MISTNLIALFCVFCFCFQKNLFKGRGSFAKKCSNIITEVGLPSSSWVNSLLEVNHGGTISPTLAVNWALLRDEDLRYTKSKRRDRAHLSFVLLS